MCGHAELCILLFSQRKQTPDKTKTMTSGRRDPEESRSVLSYQDQRVILVVSSKIFMFMPPEQKYS